MSCSMNVAARGPEGRPLRLARAPVLSRRPMPFACLASHSSSCLATASASGPLGRSASPSVVATLRWPGGSVLRPAAPFRPRSPIGDLHSLLAQLVSRHGVCVRAFGSTASPSVVATLRWPGGSALRPAAPFRPRSLIGDLHSLLARAPGRPCSLSRLAGSRCLAGAASGRPQAAGSRFRRAGERSEPGRPARFGFRGRRTLNPKQ